MREDVKNVVLVTNATDFAGPGAVDSLLEGGAMVVAHSCQFEDAAARDGFERDHPGVHSVTANTPEQAFEQAHTMAGRIDAVVSNDHWPAINSPTERASLRDLEETLASLVTAPFALVQAAIEPFRRQGGGKIVMITSCRTRLPMAGGAIPDAARAAANALVSSWARELGVDGISVNAVAPNFLYSEAYFPRATFVDDAIGRGFVESNVPVGRLGKQNEVGSLIRYLALDAPPFLNGAIIDFAGGWPVSPARPADGAHR